MQEYMWYDGIPHERTHQSLPNQHDESRNPHRQTATHSNPDCDQPAERPGPPYSVPRALIIASSMACH
jgi:hypothetical protein